MSDRMQPRSLAEQDSFVGKIVEIAVAEAMRLYHDYLGVEHILMALSRCVGGFTERMIKRLDLESDLLRATLRARAGANHPSSFEGRLVISPRLHTMLERARTEAGQSEIGERLLLLAILQSGPGLAVRTLTENGADLDHLIAEVRADSGPEASAPTLASRGDLPDGADGSAYLRRGAAPSTGTPTLDHYGRDLTALARSGKLKPVVTRGVYFAEIARALARVDRNTPVLVGEAGVGKTAIVEGLAQRIAREAEKPVVAPLSGKRIIELRPSDLVAGALARGEFEERLRDILRECAAHPEIILFIDELHTLVGAGHHAGNQDAAQLIKPALERGELRLIGATTPEEYQRYLADDKALDRRFQPIRVAETNPSEAEELLRAALPGIEARTGVRIAPEALVSAIELSVRYIHDQRLPGKAVSVLYDACSHAIVPSNDRISLLGGISADGLAPSDAPQVTTAMVEDVISRRVGFPIGAIESRMSDQLLELEDKLRQRVIAQEEAVSAVAQTLRVSFSAVRDPNRPKAVFLFTGPSGVGKTETARALAETLFADAATQQLLILDMAEFSEKHMLAQLIGSPPGYVDSDEEGRLTGWLRLHPFGIVLLDEIEKAHPRVRQALLGLFETGRITDARGRTVHGREAIYIMTANLLPTAEGASEGGEPGQAQASARPVNPSLELAPSEEHLRERLATTLTPEFVGRIDRMALYQPLGDEALKQIIQLKLNDVRNRLRPEGISLVVTAEVYDWLIQRGASRTTGARRLDRVIAAEILEPIADRLGRNKLTRGSVARVEVVDGLLHVSP